MLRDNGRISHCGHQDYRYNSRLDTIQTMWCGPSLSGCPIGAGASARSRKPIVNRSAARTSCCPWSLRGFASAYHLFAIRSPSVRRDPTGALRMMVIGSGTISRPPDSSLRASSLTNA
jgi:hypothetical protein